MMQKRRLMRLIVAGSRFINDYEFVDRVVSDYISRFDLYHLEIVCGMAKGVDTNGEQWGIVNDVPVVHFPAYWDDYGKQAGFLRNMKMAKYATDCIVILAKGLKNAGSNNMIDLAFKHKLCTRVFEYEREPQSLYGYRTEAHQDDRASDWWNAQC